MTDTKANTDNLIRVFHPAAHYASPADVMNDDELSAPEKRIILSSWASDMFAVESCPALREIPGLKQPIRLAEILAALRRLDGDDDDPPRGGGIAMRLRRPSAAAERREPRCLRSLERRAGLALVEHTRPFARQGRRRHGAGTGA